LIKKILEIISMTTIPIPRAKLEQRSQDSATVALA
jgi:hypothetical protein